HGLRVLLLQRAIPVAGAVDRERGDAFAGQVGAEQLARVPLFAEVFPALLDFEHEAGRRRIAAEPRHLSRTAMSGAAHARDAAHALRLLAPVRHAEVAEDVHGEEAVGGLAGFEELDQLRGRAAGDLRIHDLLPVKRGDPPACTSTKASIAPTRRAASGSKPTSPANRSGLWKEPKIMSQSGRSE